MRIAEIGSRGEDDFGKVGRDGDGGWVADYFVCLLVS